MHGSAGLHNPNPGSEPLAFRVPEAARQLGIKERKMWDLVLSGEVESTKIGAARVVTRAALERYLARIAGDAA